MRARFTPAEYRLLVTRLRRAARAIDDLHARVPEMFETATATDDLGADVRAAIEGLIRELQAPEDDRLSLPARPRLQIVRRKR